jgi:hypothetical protein
VRFVRRFSHVPAFFIDHVPVRLIASYAGVAVSGWLKGDGASSSG